MGGFYIADDFYDHPQISDAGIAGVLWLNGLAYVSRHGTGDYIPRAVAARLVDWTGITDRDGRHVTHEEMVQALIDTGLWTEVPKGYMVVHHRSLFKVPPAKRPPRAASVGRDPSEPDRGFWVYRLWDDTGRLIYVGSTVTLRGRLRTHRTNMGDLWTHATWEPFEDPVSMLEAERKAIQTEYPAMNVKDV